MTDIAHFPRPGQNYPYMHILSLTNAVVDPPVGEQGDRSLEGSLDEVKKLIAEQFEEQKRWIDEQFEEQKRFVRVLRADLLEFLCQLDLPSQSALC